jgi:predicted RNase H-like nuclease (RuvC/YqgF family)
LKYDQHPLSAAFPAMTEEELAALAADIKANGLLEPAIVFDGKILDGWHRGLACDRAGVKLVTQKYTGKDPVSFVKSRNWHRRQLTGSQKAAVEVALREWAERGKPKSEPGSDLHTTAQMAEAAGVSEKTIQHAKAAHHAGLGHAVAEGKVSAKTAAEVAKLPPKKLEAAKAAIERGDDPLPKKKGAKPDEADALKARVAELEEALADAGSTAQELEDKLTAFETTKLDDQQKEILRLRKQVAKLEGEVERLTRARNETQAKNNELIREVKRLRRAAA